MSHGRSLQEILIEGINQSAMGKTKLRHGKKLFGA